ncbi:hypothetical protein PUNSTDRAFT_129823 [Punctularia strigosozonata HHB-11173 SS5]|uniref:uncharacterized protein n=1 Tax=Punctularia strigosozonata (strain HHB-11173) TaxID=741275 RepID=UPI0004417800|nr:uncharacterized protein PUNSTDRAFT_129823 [Punctularia strigosozonata HHB-11173 SS5]EIN14189.1 hypothetical protein PUNSTDRAFT_129823 [Punctularia strigosozonata HHB-11173 SS5]
MGKAQKKTGKGRLDKYYKLAKEQGYRARSAFKLIQLNKKYGFLESARCCIDLCAAPGGWLQVASKYMPVNSLIVGVDLVPIKPIPRVVTFASDITTPQCRNLIRSELKDWKADVVLHDGAPNVGTAWVQDAYSQSELVLMSLKLAVEFLMKGGTFVTKVFRSADYNNLIWVFSQLFGKVEATKPPSSRNVSAEIFVVCKDFLAPKHIDPKFLDPRHVFKELSASTTIAGDKGNSANNVQANVFQPEKKRRKREGYADGDYILYKVAGAADFIRTDDPISLLGSVNKITFEKDEEKEWLTLDVTTPDVKANCDDLKVLGKGDFKTLLKWRVALRQEIGLDVKQRVTEEITEVAEIEEVDDEQQIQEELERLNAASAARTKRERRKANETKQRTIQRMQLQMTAPLDIGLEQADAALGFGQDDVFDLGGAEQALRRGSRSYARGDLEEDDDEVEHTHGVQGSRGEDAIEEDLGSDDDRERMVSAMEAELDGLYQSYRQKLSERDSKFKVKEARKKNKEREEEWGGIGNRNDDSDDSDDDEMSEEGGWDKLANTKEEDESSDESDSSSDDERLGKRKHSVAEARTRKRQKLLTTLEEPAQPSRTTQLWFSQDMFAGVDGLDDMDEDEPDEDTQMGSLADPTPEEQSEAETPSDDGDDFEVVPQDSDADAVMWDVNDEDQDEAKRVQIRKHGLTTAEAMTLAQQLVNREKTKTQLINDGFNRYSLNSKEDLPSWFLDDESKHYKPNIPVTKEAIRALRAKMRALDARPIKKVAEAKGRKKLRAAQRLEKAMKKAQGVTEASDMTEREKAQQIEKLMRKGLSSGKKKKETKVVVAKGSHKGIKGRPKGVKGRYVMVDSRMKKEVRAKKRTEKANKKRR